MTRGLGECAQDASCLAGSAVVATGALPRLSKAEAIDLATCLSALARAGLPMAAGVRAVARDLPAGQLPGALDALAARLESGQPLETAVAALGSGVPEHLRELMVVGARSGRLAETLDEVLAHERVIDDMGRRLWQVVTYPAVLFAFLVVWLLFVSLWLIPQIQVSSILTDIDDVYATYPFTTSNRVVVPNYGRRLGEFSAITPPAILTVFCGLLITVGTARAIGGRALVSRLFAHVPLLGPARWYRSLVEFCGLLAVFLKQQLPLGEALRLTSLAARDAAIRSAAAQASHDVAAGRSLADCMSGETLFPPTLVNLVEWGGRHDALADSLASAAAMYRDRFELQLRLVRIVLPPIVFLLVGATVLFVVYGLLGSISTAIRLMVYY